MHGDLEQIGQLGNGDKENSNIPVKVEGIADIIKIDAYKNISVALSKDGNLYVWGEGLSTLPMRKITREQVVDISGSLVLTESGGVYNLNDLENKISGLTNIVKISAGAAHNLAINAMRCAIFMGNEL
ncbi:MAG: hypothetical protein HFJ51_05175 [Clostridia bacterium]|nr:hypothetical protein [Clostridia bacterium]